MKRWFKYVLVIIITLVILCIAYEAKGQGCPDDYGCFFPYRNDIYSRDGIRDEFRLDPGIEGSFLIQDRDYGDFEVWTGTAGGCTDCPEGWNCDCTTFGGDVDSNATYIYESNTSVDITPAGNLTGIIYYTRTFTMNEVYQFSFCYLGGTGTEDLQFGAGNISFTDTYNWATNTWTAPLTTMAFANIGTSWTCVNAYMTVGLATKTNFLAAFAASSADGTAIYIDNVQFQRLRGEGVTGSRGNVLSVPITSDMQWGHSEVLLPRVGTGPAGWWGMQLDGTDDSLSCADATCEMDPVNWPTGGSFTVACEFITDTIAAGSGFIVSKYDAAGAQRSWYVRRETDDIDFVLSDDGTNTTNLGADNFLGINRLHKFIARYNYDGVNLSADANINVDENTVATSAIFRGPPLNTTAALQVGAVSAALFFDGTLGSCTIWEGDIGVLAANKWRNPHFPATNYGDGFYLHDCSQAASHSTCSTQICRDGTPNACQVEGTGVMAIFGQYTENILDNSFETYAGDPSVANWTDWVEDEDPGAGGGTAAITAYLADTKHGDTAVRMVTVNGTGASSTIMWGSCLVAGIGSDMHVEAAVKKLSGTANFRIAVSRYSDGACGAGIGVFTVRAYADFESGRWQILSGTIGAGDWGAAASYEIQLTQFNSNTDFLIDTVSMKVANYHTPWVENPSGGGTTTYNSRDYRLHNPLSDYCESEGADCYASGFCVGVWVNTGWTGGDTTQYYIMNVPGTAGNNNRWLIRKSANDRMYFSVYDNAAGVLHRYSAVTTSTSWTAGGWQYVEACSDNTGTLAARHYNLDNTTWYNWATGDGAGTGIQNGQSSELHPGHLTNTLHLDGHTSSINIAPYNVIWPMKGWNNGIPPVNEHPY